MRVIDMSDTPYEGTTMNYSPRGGRAGKRKRSVSVLRQAPRGLHSGYKRRAKHVAPTAAPMRDTPTVGYSYQDLVKRFGAVGTLED